MVCGPRCWHGVPYGTHCVPCAESRRRPAGGRPAHHNRTFGHARYAYVGKWFTGQVGWGSTGFWGSTVRLGVLDGNALTNTVLTPIELRFPGNVVFAAVVVDNGALTFVKTIRLFLIKMRSCRGSCTTGLGLVDAVASRANAYC